MKIIAECGNTMFVVEVGKNIYSLVNTETDSCLFSRRPDSFYKQGYFTVPTSVSTNAFAKVYKTLKRSVEYLNGEKGWELCLGGIKPSSVASAISGEPRSTTDGGPGSGNHGHAGRPGQVGGSAPGGGRSMRSGSKETGYTSFTKNRLFNGIASHARAAKRSADFVHRMNDEQKEALKNQWEACGAKESLSVYAERIYNMLHNRKGSEIRQKSNPVDGKDISDTWEYDDSGKRSWETEATKEIDTEIEAIIHAQGYDGVPKVVSKEEFDRITEEHPEMPLLYRTFAAPDGETLDQYDRDLEKGFFYVDCGTGGAGFGQGMYCAGVYQQEPLHKLDDHELDEEFNSMKRFGQARPIVFTDSKNNGYTINQIVTPDENGDLLTKTPYIFDKNDGSRQMLQMDENGIWKDVNSGEEVRDESVDELIKNSVVYECKNQDLGVYKDAYTEKREAGIKGALEEMKHYRSLNLRRIAESDPHVAPDGKTMVVGESDGQNIYMYYDPEQFRDFSTPPEDGQMIAYWEKESNVAAETIITYEGGRIKGTFVSWDPAEGDKWAPLEGYCEKVEIDPQASTRLMTLDPSAKIISYKDLQSKRTELIDKRQEERSEFIANAKMDFVRDLTNQMMDRNRITGEKREKYAEMFWLYAFGVSKEDSDRMDELQSELGENNGTGLFSIFGRRWNNYDPPKPVYKPIPHDYGVLACMLGYDAINAETHGESGSYTVVLNRTKLIVSEERVDIEG